MKKYLLTGTLLLMAAFLIPGLLSLSGAGPGVAGGNSSGRVLPASREENLGPRITLYDAVAREYLQMPLEEYLVGVVGAEMPAGFEESALQAQAVVARSYTVNQLHSMGGSGCPSHPGADICSDYTCCQAWKSYDRLMESWPVADRQYYYDRLQQAVISTRGLALTYQGRVIDAVFHSTCGGQTEAGAEIWLSRSYPYLVTVTCGYCNHSPHYREQFTFSLAEMAGKITGSDTVPVMAEGRSLMEITGYTSGGRVKEIRFGAATLTGTDFRFGFDLPSTWLEWEINGKEIVITTRGYGHGAGLCQYGADGMANSGCNYREITAHYYPGTVLQSIDYHEE